MTLSTVADMTVDEFRALIREVVAETISALLTDSDTGLELRADVIRRLQLSSADLREGAHTTSAQEVAKRLGLDW